MPAGRRTQNSATFYGVIVVTALFIVAAALAVVFYLQSEKYRTEAQKAQKQPKSTGKKL